MTTVLEGGEWSAARPARTLPQGKTRYPFYRRLGRSGRAENLAPPGFDTRTFQPVAQSLYRLSYPAHTLNPYRFKFNQRGFTENAAFKERVNRDGLGVRYTRVLDWPSVYILRKFRITFRQIQL